MAGKKQHFIPQHFLKPFTIPGSGDHLWMFRRSKSYGIKVARKNAAAQEYFYSKPSDDGSPTLDDLVTDNPLERLCAPLEVVSNRRPERLLVPGNLRCRVLNEPFRRIQATQTVAVAVALTGLRSQRF